ncbi:hypothetical protein PENTCL1PPCAC_14025, partial [Pristionchus entomophagus]
MLTASIRFKFNRSFTGLYFMAASIVSNGPMTVILTVHSAKRLWEKKLVVLYYYYEDTLRLNLQTAFSDRTAKMAEKLLKVFIMQLIGAMAFMLFPLIMLFTSLMIDFRGAISDEAMALLRVVPLIFFVFDPLHFPLIFILKHGGHRTV